MENEFEVYRILDREFNMPCGSYTRGYHDKYDFDSISSARQANCHGVFEDKIKYKIAKYKVTYELVEDDCDCTKEELIAEIEQKIDKTTHDIYLLDILIKNNGELPKNNDTSMVEFGELFCIWYPTINLDLSFLQGENKSDLEKLQDKKFDLNKQLEEYKNELKKLL